MLNPFKLHKILLHVLLFSILLFSCGGGSDDGDPIDTSTPSNLAITANLVGANTNNTNGDGSGKVIFNFSADNATSYKINFGNGDTAETSSNSISYTYTGGGITNYNVFVSAYKADKFISKNITITIKVNTGLIFSDEFDTPGSPNTNKWTYDLGAGGWGNGESQYYTNRTDNVVIANGILKITAKKESYQGAAYTSTRMKTQGKFDFKYGKVEVRAKLPQGGGTWPAIWMLGSNITTVGWPACGEADIMEHAGNRQGIVQSAMHTPSSNGNTANVGSQTLADVSTAFHVYAVEWTSQSMVFSVDGVVHYTYNPATKNSSTWPFDAKQFLILNVAMGGSFGGGIDPAFTESSMEIDYVRVYQ
ncbi:MAG: glycoside hydrolase family 16 protein [Gelidibacter sp.]|nr:glycoside hydrolase family 16 protein [Gelidibacter sp.]